MKFIMYPHKWTETLDAIEAGGHEHVDHLDSAELLFFNGLPAEFPDLPENVKIVQTAMAGIDGLVDKGVVNSSVRWANAAGLYSDTVAESTLALLLAQLHGHVGVSRAKSWDTRESTERSVSWLYDKKTVAILGAGGIGRRLIEMLAPFHVKSIAVNNSGRPVDGADETFAMENAGHIWSEADYFVLLMPLTESTRGMIDADILAQMKPSAVVVNVGRGPLLNTDDLVVALKDGTIAGAALDVTDPEPLPDNHPLWNLDNVVITPHIANTSERIRSLTGALTVKNIELYQAGEQMSTEVDVVAGY